MKDGVLKLGKLKNIYKIEVNGHGSFQILHDEMLWNQNDDIHIIHGESVEIPINFDPSGDLKPYHVSLKMHDQDSVLRNMFSSIKL